MLIAHVLRPLICQRKKNRIYFNLIVAFEFDRFESSWLQSVENIAKEGVQNTQKYSSLIRTN